MLGEVRSKPMSCHPSHIITSFSLGAGVGVGVAAGVGILMIYLYQYRRKDQGHQSNQGHMVSQEQRSLSKCTCRRTGQIRCEQHDPILMWNLSEYLSSDVGMIKLGLTLRIRHNIIEACRLDHKDSIILSVYSMLINHWYKTQDGLGLKSKGLKKLKRALKAPAVGQSLLVDSVIRTHFLNMDKDYR